MFYTKKKRNNLYFYKKTQIYKEKIILKLNFRSLILKFVLSLARIKLNLL